MTTAQFGTMRYAAPELAGSTCFKPDSRGHEELNFARKILPAAVDVYAFGLLLWEVTHREVPFAGSPGHYVLLQLAPSGKRPDIDSAYVSEPVASLIAACWHQNPSTRPAMPDCAAYLGQQVNETTSDPHPLSDVAEAGAVTTDNRNVDLSVV